MLIGGSSGRLQRRHPAAAGSNSEVLDSFNPTDDELRDWAQTDAFRPTQDFDLIVAEIERVPLLVELASSRQRSFPSRPFPGLRLRRPV
jgi:hypothetical protein